MEKLSNTETELKKSVAYKKNVYSSLLLLLLLLFFFVFFFCFLGILRKIVVIRYVYFAKIKTRMEICALNILKDWVLSLRIRLAAV